MNFTMPITGIGATIAGQAMGVSHHHKPSSNDNELTYDFDAAFASVPNLNANTEVNRSFVDETLHDLPNLATRLEKYH